MAEEVIITAEHQAMVEELLGLLKEYQQTHYYPAAGWARSQLAYDIRESLLKSDNASQVGHTHTLADVDGVEEYVEGQLEGYSPTSHTHDITTLGGFSTSPEPSKGVVRGEDGRFAVLEPQTPGQAANKGYIDLLLEGYTKVGHEHPIENVVGLRQLLDGKSAVSHKHNITDVRDLRETLDLLAGGGGIDLSTKADLIDGKVSLEQIPALPISRVTNLQTTLNSKATLTNGKLPRSVLPELKSTDLTDFTTAVESATSDFVKLVGGKLPENALPDIAKNTLVQVVTRQELLELTTAQVQVGDVALITAGADMGTYQLTSADPTSFSSWTRYVSRGQVESVNGKTGIVNLTASDVGARSTGNIPIGDITGLNAVLNSKLEQSALTPYATTDSLATTKTEILEQYRVYPQIDFVSDTRLSSLSGQQSIDGVLTPIGSRVLLTKQSSSSQNGIWVVSSSGWYRSNETPDGSFIPRGSIVACRAGVSNANSLWQLTTTAGVVVGTNAQTWLRVLSASGLDASSIGSGLEYVENKIRVKAGPGVTVTQDGVSLSTEGLMRKFSNNIAGGSKVVTFTHGLNTRDVLVSIVEATTGDIVLAGVTVTGLNTVSIEFDVAPTTGQYRAIVFG